MPCSLGGLGPSSHAGGAPPRRRYEKYDSLGATREKTDDPFTDELNMVLDKVQDLQLVRGVLLRSGGGWCGRLGAGAAAPCCRGCRRLPAPLRLKSSGGAGAGLDQCAVNASSHAAHLVAECVDKHDRCSG